MVVRVIVQRRPQTIVIGGATHLRLQTCASVNRSHTRVFHRYPFVVEHFGGSYSLIDVDLQHLLDECARCRRYVIPIRRRERENALKNELEQLFLTVVVGDEWREAAQHYVANNASCPYVDLNKTTC